MATIKTQILLRNDTKQNWEQYNPTLAAAEIGIEFSVENGVNVKKIKIGDGITPWNELDYFMGDIPGDLAERIEALETTVGDNNSGLVKTVNDLTTVIGDATTGLAKDVADLKDVVGDNTQGLVKDVADNASAIDNLETVVGDSNSGLVKDVTDLKTTVGDATSGLVKDVADNTTAISGLSGRLDTVEGNITSINDEIDAIDNKIATLSAALRFEGTAYADIAGGVITLYSDPEKTQVIDPTDPDNKGAVYQVEDKEYACNGAEWVELGFNIDLSGLATKAEVEAIEIGGVTLGADKAVTASELISALGIDTISSSLTTVTNAVSTLTADVDRLDDQINNATTGIEARLSDVEEQLDDSNPNSLAGRVDNLETEVSGLSNTVDGITPIISTLSTTYVPQTRTIAGLTLSQDISVQELANVLGVGGSLIGDVDTDYFALDAIAGQTASYKLTLNPNITNTIILNGGNSQG